jgi:putative ABC transport system permease protein
VKLVALPGEAWRAMALNGLRTGLTMLGMVIGVGAVVLMLAVGDGARHTVNEQIRAMGSNLFMILSGASTSSGVRMGSGTKPTITVADAEALAKLASLDGVAPVQSQTAQLAFGASNWSSQVYGVTPEFLRVRDWALEAGRGISDTDVRSAARVVVLGQVVKKELFGVDDPVGQTVRIKNLPFTVVGVAVGKGQSLSGRDQDDVAFVPLTTAQSKLFGVPFPGTVGFIMARAKSSELMDEAEAEIRQALRQRHRLAERDSDDFTVRNLSSTAETAATTARILTVMLGTIASISLVVGGIGIMNIMLVSVTERTREIGVRMAVGARRRDILLQFLLEAVLICGIGGSVGVLLGIGGAWLVSDLAGMTVVVSGTAILLAFAFSAATGIFFGYYPAHKAARLQPVEALRYE